MCEALKTNTSKQNKKSLTSFVVDSRKDTSFSALISAVTQKRSLWVAHGCSKHKSLAVFQLIFCEVPQVKNRLFRLKPLPLYQPLRFVQFGQKIAEKYSWFRCDEGC